MEDIRRFVLSIVHYLRNILTNSDLSPEEMDSIEIAIDCLKSAYDLDELNEIQRRPLLDMFLQVVDNPLSFRDRQRAESLKEQGNTKMTNRQYERAERDYSRAIRLDKYDPIFYCKRAGARIRLQQYSEAISDCRQALNLSPDYAKAYGRMGQAYALMDRHRRAARCFRQALELETENETYRNNLRVAEQRVAEDSAPVRGLFIQGSSALSSALLSSALGGGTGNGAGGMPRPSFVILSKPHIAKECESGHGPCETTHDGIDSEIVFKGGQTSDSDDSEGSIDSDEGLIHLRALFAIPFTKEEDETDQVSGDDRNPVQQIDTADTETSTEEQKESPNYLETFNETPENPPEFSEPQTLETKEISESIQNADRQVVKSDPNVSRKSSDGSMGKDMLDESKEQNESLYLENKDTVKKNPDRTPVFNFSDISNFFKNFGKSSASTQIDKSNDNSRNKKDDNMKKGPEEAAEVLENKEINEENNTSKGDQEK